MKNYVINDEILEVVYKHDLYDVRSYSCVLTFNEYLDEKKGTS